MGKKQFIDIVGCVSLCLEKTSCDRHIYSNFRMNQMRLEVGHISSAKLNVSLNFNAW